MKYFLLFLLISLAYCEDQYGYTTKYIDMPLDHFSFTTNATFKLRYLVNDSYYSDEGPIFFYTGNEGDITMFAQNTGLMFDLAPKFQALIIFAEHRFYGETQPFDNVSDKTLETLGYLSAQQALADFVYLINDLQKQYSKKSGALDKLPVIAFGGSYGGMLSAWLRIRYPYAVTGAISSSAPIWGFKGLTPCGDFLKIVTDVFKRIGSEKCMETIKNSWKILRRKMSTDIGKTNISSVFRLCEPLTDGAENALINWLKRFFVITVMMNYPYPTNYLNPLPGNPVRTICEKMDRVDYSDEDGLILSISKGWEVFTSYNETTPCIDLTHAPWPTDVTILWQFQTCTELIMPICSTDEDMFENYSGDFKSFSERCSRMFGIRPRNEEVPILEFGGKHLEAASNIIFSNGLLDPWASGGVLKDISPQVLAVVIPDGAHHYDLRGENPLDTESVKKAREFHKKQISKWLDQFYFQNLPQYNYLLKKNLML